MGQQSVELLIGLGKKFIDNHNNNDHLWMMRLWNFFDIYTCGCVRDNIIDFKYAWQKTTKEIKQVYDPDNTQQEDRNIVSQSKNIPFRNYYKQFCNIIACDPFPPVLKQLWNSHVKKYPYLADLKKYLENEESGAVTQAGASIIDIIVTDDTTDDIELSHPFGDQFQTGKVPKDQMTALLRRRAELRQNYLKVAHIRNENPDNDIRNELITDDVDDPPNITAEDSESSDDNSKNNAINSNNNENSDELVVYDLDALTKQLDTDDDI